MADRFLDFAIILFWGGVFLSIFSLSSLIINFHGPKIVGSFRQKEKTS
jgi:hypothetical protein